MECTRRGDRIAAALACFGIAACGARTGVRPGVAVVETDASIVAADAHDVHDAAPALDATDAAPFCPPGAPCDCFVGGELIWDHVIYSVADASTVGGAGDPGQGWGRDMHLEARCAGTYTLTATVVARGSRCDVVVVHTVAEIRDPHFGARVRMPLWTSNNACASEALTRTGGETCMEVSWSATGGGTGSLSLGCFAAFGPYCFGGPGCGAGGMASGASGDWTF